MTAVQEYPTTRQGVRDLDNPLSASPVNVGPNERVLSTLGGGILVGFGLCQASLMGLILAAAGGALAYRGITGHCHTYAAVGINTAR